MTRIRSGKRSLRPRHDGLAIAAIALEFDATLVTRNRIDFEQILGLIGFVMPMEIDRRDKGYRGDASQFFVAGELCRRRLVAVVTLGNCPNTDILCSNAAGTKFAHIQVKTFVPGNRTCSVGLKSERRYGENFFWVLGGIPTPESVADFEYYVIPSKDMASNMAACFRLWADTPGAKGQTRNAENTIRAVYLPPKINPNGWDIAAYKDRWDLIEQCVTG